MNRFRIKNTLILAIVINITFLCACNQRIENTDIKPETTTLIQQENFSSTNVNEAPDNLISDPIKDSIKLFYDAIANQDAKKMGKISSEEGMFFLRTFASGFGTRGQEVFETITPLKLPNGLTFSFVQEEAPIKLKTEFRTNEKEIKGIEPYITKEGFEWDNLIKINILNTFGKLVENDKEIREETRIYILKDGSFCLAQFSGSRLQYSRWVVFEKKGNEFFLKIIAIIY